MGGKFWSGGKLNTPGDPNSGYDTSASNVLGTLGKFGSMGQSGTMGQLLGQGGQQKQAAPPVNFQSAPMPYIPPPQMGGMPNQFYGG